MHPLAEAPRPTVRPGTRVGDHLIIRGVLGEGGTSIVYDAFHTGLRAAVAVKVLHVQGSYVNEARARLVREAEICAALEDRHIPRVHDIGELDDGTPYIVMERVQGPTLSRLLRQGPLPMRRSCEVALDLLEALSFIHRRGILHRDIKPGNLIVERRRKGKLGVKLMDFGVGKIIRRARDATSITRQGEVIGTPCYMAPEQIIGHESLDARADVYAAGVVLYEMLTGRAPYEGHSVGEVVAAVLRDEIKPVCELRPEVPKTLALVIERATSKHPGARYASARAMRTAVMATLVDLPKTRCVGPIWHPPVDGDDGQDTNVDDAPTVPRIVVPAAGLSAPSCTRG